VENCKKRKGRVKQLQMIWKGALAFLAERGVLGGASEELCAIKT